MGLADFHPRYFSVTEDGDVAVLTFGVSHINDEENIEELGHEMFALSDQFGFRKIVLNMGGVQYITSSVVGKMITLHRKLHRSHGRLVLCELTPGVEEVLSASRLLNYFTHMKAQEQAVDFLNSHDEFEGDSTIA